MFQLDRYILLLISFSITESAPPFEVCNEPWKALRKKYVALVPGENEVRVLPDENKIIKNDYYLISKNTASGHGFWGWPKMHLRSSIDEVSIGDKIQSIRTIGKASASCFIQALTVFDDGSSGHIFYANRLNIPEDTYTQVSSINLNISNQVFDCDTDIPTYSYFTDIFSYKSYSILLTFATSDLAVALYQGEKTIKGVRIAPSKVGFFNYAAIGVCKSSKKGKPLAVVAINENSNIILAEVDLDQLIEAAVEIDSLKDFFKTARLSLKILGTFHFRLVKFYQTTLIQMIYPIKSWVLIAHSEHSSLIIYYHATVLSGFYSLPYCKTTSNGVLCIYPLWKKTLKDFVISWGNWKVWPITMEKEVDKAIDLIQCFIFNDCFGCVIMSRKYSLSCIWKSSNCLPGKTPEAFICSNVSAVTPRKIFAFKNDYENITLTVLNVRMKNPLMKISISEKISPSVTYSSYIHSHSTISFIWEQRGKIIKDIDLSFSIDDKSFLVQEKISFSLNLFRPDIFTYAPKTVLSGNRLRLTLSWESESLWSEYKKPQSANIGNFTCKLKQAEKNTFVCEVTERIMLSPKTSTTFLMKVNKAKLKANFQVVQAPNCKKFTPQKILANWKDFLIIEGENFLSAIYPKMKVGFHELKCSYTNTSSRCALPDFSSTSKVTTHQINLESHGFDIIDFCPKNLKFMIYPLPSFGYVEWRRAYRQVFFEAPTYLIDLPVNISIETPSGKFLTSCILNTNKHQDGFLMCSLSPYVELDSKCKAILRIGASIFDLGFIELEPEKRIHIGRIILILIAVIVVIIFLGVLALGAWFDYTQGKKKNSATFLKYLAKARLLPRKRKPIFEPSLKVYSSGLSAFSPTSVFFKLAKSSKNLPMGQAQPSIAMKSVSSATKMNTGPPKETVNRSAKILLAPNLSVAKLEPKKSILRLKSKTLVSRSENLSKMQFDLELSKRMTISKQFK